MQTCDLKSPDLKRISHTGFICMLPVYKYIFTSDVICTVYGIFLQDKHVFKLIRWVCQLRTTDTGDWSNTKYSLFLYVRNYSGMIKHERISFRN